MSTPPIQYSGPPIDPSVPWAIRQHLQLFYQKLGNHTQAMSLLQQNINNVKAGATTNTIIEGGAGGGGGSTSSTGIAVNNQSGETSYVTALGDNLALLIFSDSSAVAVSLTTQDPPYGFIATNLGAGTVTFTPASGTVNGGATFALPQNYTSVIAFDGTNWWASEFPVVPVSTPAVSHEWLASYDSTTGAFTQTQPAIVDVSGLSAALALLAPLASPTFSGTVTQPTPPVLTGATTATSATTGAATALPADPAGYLEMSINGTVFKIPYYNI